MEIKTKEYVWSLKELVLEVVVILDASIPRQAMYSTQDFLREHEQTSHFGSLSLFFSKLHEHFKATTFARARSVLRVKRKRTLSIV